MENPPAAPAPLSRRDFVRVRPLAATAVASGVGLGPATARAADAPAPAAGTVIGFQAEVPYLLKYGSRASWTTSRTGRA